MGLFSRRGDDFLASAVMRERVEVEVRRMAPDVDLAEFWLLSAGVSAKLGLGFEVNFFTRIGREIDATIEAVRARRPDTSLAVLEALWRL